VKESQPQVLWDITKDPMIDVLDENDQPTGEKKTVQPWSWLILSKHCEWS